MKKNFLVFWPLLAAAVSPAQENLRLQDAVSIALQNNYAIRIARAEEKIDRNNASWGNAGILPEVTMSASAAKSVNDSKQEYVTGNLIDRTNARSDSRNLNVALNWTIFDGLAMFTNLEKLHAYRHMGELATRSAIEGTLSSVITAYFDVVQQARLLRARDEATALSKKRLRIAEENFKMGSGSKFDVLNARVDVNDDLSAVLRQRLAFKSSKIALNQLLAREDSSDFSAADSIRFLSPFDYDSLRTAVLGHNVTLLVARENRRAADMERKAAWGPRLPKIGVNAAYNLARSESQSGFMKSNENKGLTYGLSASYTLFDGFNIHRQQQNAEVAFRAAELSQKETELNLMNELQRLYQQYRDNSEISNFESENTAVAHDNVNAALEKFQIGAISALDLRDVQRKLVDAQARLWSALYQTKAAETELLRMSGRLLTAKQN
jgi:outer membrane protein